MRRFLYYDEDSVNSFLAQMERGLLTTKEPWKRSICNDIKDFKNRGEALLKAEAGFNLWMDIYPESKLWQKRLKIPKAHDDVMDKMGLYQKGKITSKNSGEK